MFFGRFSKMRICPHRAPPTKNRMLNKESQEIPVDQARFRAAPLTSWNQILNNQPQAIHMTRVLPGLIGSTKLAFCG